jgi:hypothetical protein
VPVNRVDENKKESRWVVVASELAVTLCVSYFVDHGLRFDLLGFRVLRNADKVFIYGLCRFKVFRYAVIVLA